MEHNLHTLKRTWVTGTPTEILTEIKKIEAELRENDFYKYPDIDLNANKLIKEILGE